jgi:hypothetical protein
VTENQRNGQSRGLKPFVKGDSRINRHGRPLGFDLVRKLAQQVSHEEVTLSNGQKMSVIEAILRSWVLSKEPALQRALVEIALGKVPPTKVETNAPEPGTVLRLHFACEEPGYFDKNPAMRARILPDSATSNEGPHRPLLPDAD